MVLSERIHVVIRADAGTGSPLLPKLQPLRLVAETSTSPRNDFVHEWFVEVEIDLGGMSLDPEYWLRHCQGFLVDSESGETLGVVDDFEFASGLERVIALVVASGWFGRHVRRVAVTDVQAIVPSRRRLVVKEAARRARAVPERT